MTYLIDHLKNNPTILPEVSECPYFNKIEVLSRLQEAICINAQNVSDYFKARDDQDYEWKIDDVPFAKPPFPSCWIEYQETFDANGIKFLKALYPQWQTFALNFHGQLFLSGNGKKHRNPILTLSFKANKDNKNKVIKMTYMGAIYYEVDSKGTILELQSPSTWWKFWEHQDKNKFQLFDFDKTIERNIDICRRSAELHGRDAMQERKSFWHSLELHWICCTLTFSFCNCRNVTTTVIRDGDIHRQSYPKVPLTKIYTLMIDPLKEKIASENKGNSNLSYRALHICRGHFKDFSHGNGLFGRHKGTYWWPMTTRGNKEYGEIKKDYAIVGLKT